MDELARTYTKDIMEGVLQLSAAYADSGTQPRYWNLFADVGANKIPGLMGLAPAAADRSVNCLVAILPKSIRLGKGCRILIEGVLKIPFGTLLRRGGLKLAQDLRDECPQPQGVLCAQLYNAGFTAHTGRVRLCGVPLVRVHYGTGIGKAGVDVCL